MSEPDGCLEGEDIRFYHGGAGEGIIIFDARGVRAIPPPDTGWRKINSGNWRKGMRPISGEPGTDDFGASAEFLVVAAFALTVLALNRLVASHDKPCRSIAEAQLQLRMDAMFSAWATEARLQALTRGGTLTSDWDVSLVSDMEGFIDRFKKLRRARMKAGSRVLDDAIGLYQGRLQKLVDEVEISVQTTPLTDAPMNPPAIGSDVLALCRVIATAAKEAGGAPTQAMVRKIFSRQESVALALADVGSATNRFGEFLAKSGFGWLPHGRSGRRRKVNG